MNYAHVAGHLGADPEVRYTKTNKKVTTLRVAARARKNQADDTIWWRVTIWGDQFDQMMPYLKKGSPIFVMGEFKKPEIFTDRNGQPQVSMEITAFHIQFSPFGKPSQNHESGSNAGFSENNASSSGENSPINPYMHDSFGEAVKGSTFDDEVPF